MGVSDPLPAGRVILFGSLEFRATGNGYLMQLLSPGRDPVTPTLPARRDRRSGQRSRQARAERRRAARHNSPMWVEAGERASRPLVGFGVLIDNTIKGLTCLHEIMSRYLICGMI